MSRINVIQNKLREMGDAAFQKLADEYLHAKGYERINPIGSVIGSDKVRTGTPDSLIELFNGKYVFAEYTTEKKGLSTKLRTDVEKCLDEAKTGVPITRIEEIILCHTSLLSASDEHSLSELCRGKGVKLQTFGIGPISFDLNRKFHGLARDHLVRRPI